MNNDDFMRFLASWALVHETADEGWKAAVVRGEGQETGAMEQGPEAFVDGLSAAIAERKEQLKAELAAGATRARWLASRRRRASGRTCGSRSPS